MRRIELGVLAIAWFIIASYPALAEDKPNCDPRLGLTDGSCYARPDPPWWTCEDDRYREKEVNPDQQKRLDAFALRLFTPKPQGPDEMNRYFPRSELVKRFGTPTGSKSKKVRASPQDPTDDTIWAMTTWEFPGFRIATRAEEPGSDALSIEEGEIFDASVSMRDGLRIGQSIDRWVDRFGRPECRMRQIAPFGRDHVAYKWNASYFACTADKTYPCEGAYRIELYLDAAGQVKRMKWMLAPMH